MGKERRIVWYSGEKKSSWNRNRKGRGDLRGKNRLHTKENITETQYPTPTRRRHVSRMEEERQDIFHHWMTLPSNSVICHPRWQYGWLMDWEGMRDTSPGNPSVVICCRHYQAYLLKAGWKQISHPWWHCSQSWEIWTVIWRLREIGQNVLTVHGNWGQRSHTVLESKELVQRWRVLVRIRFDATYLNVQKRHIFFILFLFVLLRWQIYSALRDFNGTNLVKMGRWSWDGPKFKFHWLLQIWGRAELQTQLH